jgi:hypothetical protein
MIVLIAPDDSGIPRRGTAVTNTGSRPTMRASL